MNLDDLEAKAMAVASLKALIERVEKATGPSAELDAAIWCAVYAPDGAWVEQSQFNGAWCVYENGPRRKRLVEHPTARQLPYTASIDAALTLVSEGWKVENLAEWDSPMLRARGPWMAQVRRRTDQDSWVSGFSSGPDCHHAPSAALALCLAALRSRLSVMGE